MNTANAAIGRKPTKGKLEYPGEEWNIWGRKEGCAGIEMEFCFSQEEDWMIQFIAIATPSPTTHKQVADALEKF